MTEKAAELRSEHTEDPSTGSGPIEMVSGPIEDRGRRKVREGVVISDKMDKTIVVTVEDRVKHRLYGKVLRQTSRLKAHDEQNAAALGDRVRVMETRPMSATKRWRLVEIVEKAK
jgi:small subunit ribosomal protein S17